MNIYYPSLGTAVKAPSQKYAGKLEGLCGDCNKDPRNDLMTSDGLLTDNVDDFAVSWLYDRIPGQTKETCSNQPKQVCELNIKDDPCLVLLDTERFGQVFIFYKSVSRINIKKYLQIVSCLIGTIHVY